MVCSLHQNLTNVFTCLRICTITGCPLRSNKDNKISIALMLHFFYPPFTPRESWVRTTTSLKLAIAIFSICKTLTSDHFDKIAFSLNKKFTADVIYSHADTLTGCSLGANNVIKFRAHRRFICCNRPHMSRENWVGMSMAFSSSMKMFLSDVCTRHACGCVDSIFFCCPSFGLHTHLL